MLCIALCLVSFQDASSIIPDQYIVVFDSYDNEMKAQSVLQSMQPPSTSTSTADADADANDGTTAAAAGSILPKIPVSWKRPSIMTQFDAVFHGFTLSCSEDILDTLSRQPGLLAIVPDAIVTLDDTQVLGVGVGSEDGDGGAVGDESMVTEEKSRLRGGASTRSLNTQSR